MPRASRELSIFPITLREVTVRRIEDLTQHLRRVTVGGPDMGAGIHDGHPVPAFRSDGFDDHVKLVIPTGRDDFGEVGVQDGERFDWAPGALGRTRDYTVRRVRDDELELDFVVHEGGLAADWALRVAVGDPLRFAGPKTSATVSREVDWHLLIADETALPAVARWLEEAPRERARSSSSRCRPSRTGWTSRRVPTPPSTGSCGPRASLPGTRPSSPRRSAPSTSRPDAATPGAPERP